MTKREFLNAVIANTTLPAEMIEYATDALAKMDAVLARRAEKPTKAQIENAPLMDYIATEILSETPLTASTVAELLSAHVGDTVKVQKASALLRAIVAEGKAVAETVKVPGHGKAQAYRLA